MIPVVVLIGWCGTALAAGPTTTQLPVPIPTAQDFEPSAVALSGDILVVGNFFSQAAYVFARNGSTFAYEATLSVNANGFGGHVAASGSRSRVVVAATADTNGSGVASGAVYVFERVQGTWTQRARLTASDGAANDEFGQALALDGDRLVVGAPFHSSGGAAYVFDDVAGVWSQTARLAADVAGSDFGWSVAVDGGLVLVGMLGPAAGYVFTCAAGSCSQTAKLVPPPQGSPVDSFGYSVAVRGQRALIGAPNTGGYLQSLTDGYAAVYDFDGSAWQRTAVWTSPQSAGFGTSVALGATRAVVGAPLNTDIIQPGYSGGVYVYDRGISGWSPPAYLPAGPPVNISGGIDPTVMAINFGTSVAADGDFITAAPIETGWNASTLTGSGAAVLFSLAPAVVVPAGGPLLPIALALALLALGVRRQRGIASLMPPSTVSTAPVVKAERGEARKRAASATARGGMGPTPSRLRRR
jgi:hypothetical protein